MTHSISAFQPDDSASLRALFAVICDETATPDQFKTFEETLRNDTEAMDSFARFMQVYVLLQRKFAPIHRLVDDECFEAHSTAADTPPTIGQGIAPILSGNGVYGTAGYFSSGWPVAYLVATVILAVGLVIGAITHVSQPGKIVFESPTRAKDQDAKVPDTGDPSRPVVGRITGVVDCVWDGTGFRVQGSGESGQRSAIRGQPLQSTSHYSLATDHFVRLGDRLALRSGLVEITYDSGAKVLLQGPVTYEVESPAGGYLSVGKLTAKLEERREGREERGETMTSGESSILHSSSNPQSLIPNPAFAVRTPTATVTDLGTEFGVVVGNDGRTVSRVFRGTVKIQAMSSDGTPEGDALVLRENESAGVDRSDGRRPSTVHRGGGENTIFVRPDQLSERLEADRLGPFHRWQSQSQSMRSDRSVVAFYDFQQVPGSPAVLRNVAGNGDASLDGVIHGAAWTAGRMPGKQALYFDGNGAHVKVNIPRRMTQVTVSAWLTIEMISDQAVLGCLLMSDLGLGHSPESCHWEIKHSGEVFFSSMAFFNHTTDAPMAWQTWGAHRWRHIALSVDPDKQEAICYVDGRKQGFRLTYPRKFAIAFGSARIGSWLSDEGRSDRSLRGRIDELWILARAMSDDEIFGLYESGVPRAKKLRGDY